MISGRVLLAPLLLLVSVGPACGLGGDGGSGPFSIASALAELPVPPDVDGGQRIIVTVADLDAASEANGAERPDDGADAEAVDLWWREATGASPRDGEVRPVFVGPIDTVALGIVAADAITEELGWSPATVDRVAEVVAPPFGFAAVDAEVDADALADADLLELGDGVYTAGEGEDREGNPDAATRVRPIGVPLRTAATDGRLVASTDTESVEEWLADDAETLADDEDLAGIAAALDDAGAVSALLTTGPFTPGPLPPSAIEELPIEEEFSAVGIGWAADDGESVVTVAYAFADGEDAETAADQVEAAYARGISSETREPIADRLDLEAVDVDGAIVRARLRLLDGPPGLVAQMLTVGDVPFAHR